MSLPTEGQVVQIFITPRGGHKMQSVWEVEAVADKGLRGDRYCNGMGQWAGSDACHVTLIDEADLENIEKQTGLQLANGEHRRNLVIRGMRLDDVLGKQIQFGEAIMHAVRPRPPCRYLESLTEPGMLQSLTGLAGVCARVVKSGWIRTQDAIIVMQAGF